MKAKKGAIAVCSLGTLGVITKDGLQEVEYPDGNKGEVYVGVHLTDKLTLPGERWSSRNPKVIGYTDLPVEEFWAIFRDAITNL